LQYNPILKDIKLYLLFMTQLGKLDHFLSAMHVTDLFPIIVKPLEHDNILVVLNVVFPEALSNKPFSNDGIPQSEKKIL
jgi:NAD dependent epimerase/dehydratase family enzyme